MNRLLFAAVVLLFASPLLLAGTPSTGDVIIRVRDAQLRPVVGANVTFDYVATDPVLGELRRTDVVRTDQFGVAQKRLSADFNTPYSINVSFHGASEIISSSWMGGFDRFVNLPLLDFMVRLIDTEGNPLPNVPLGVQTDSGDQFATKTNATGFCLFSQYDRNTVYTIHAQYGSAESVILVVPDSKLHAIQFPTYSLEIKTFTDDAATLLTDMSISYDAMGTVVRDSTGITSLFRQVPEGDVAIVVRYANRTHADRFYLNSSTSRSYVFDVHPPVIGTPSLSPERPVPENEVAVSVNVTDPGPNGSGLPDLVNMIPPVELYYSLDGAVWKSVHMYPDANNVSYRGRVPGVPKDSIVRFYIVAYDRENNSATSARYSYNTVVNPPCTGPGCGGTQSLLDEALGMLWDARWWISALLLVGVAAYYVIRTRT